MFIKYLIIPFIGAYAPLTMDGNIVVDGVQLYYNKQEQNV